MNSAFAAGFFGQYSARSAERREAARRREERLEDIMEQRRTNLLQLAASRGGSYGSTGTSGSGSQESKTAEINAYGKYLVGKGVEEDTVASLMATNDVSGLGQLVKNIQTAEAKYESTGESFTPDLLNGVIQDTVSVDSKTYTLNMDDFLGSLGLNPEDYEYSPEELAIAGVGQEKVVPGKIVPGVIADPAEKFSPSDLKNITEQLIEPSLDMAKKELAGYKKMVADLQEGKPLYEDLNGDMETVNYFRNLATDRISSITGVIDSTKEDSYSDLLDMYGRNSFEALDRYYNLTERGVPIPYLGDGSAILQLPSGQEEYFDHVLGQYGITNYKYYTPE